MHGRLTSEVGLASRILYSQTGHSDLPVPGPATLGKSSNFSGRIDAGQFWEMSKHILITTFGSIAQSKTIVTLLGNESPLPSLQEES